MVDVKDTIKELKQEVASRSQSIHSMIEKSGNQSLRDEFYEFDVSVMNLMSEYDRYVEFLEKQLQSSSTKSKT